MSHEDIFAPLRRAEAEFADLRARLAAAEAREAILRKCIIVAERLFADADYGEDVEWRAARDACHRLARKPDTSALSAALASEWERAYRTGLEAAASAIEASDDVPPQTNIIQCCADLVRELPVPARPEDKP